MTFPATPIDVTVEMLIAGVWTEITSDVLVRAGINIDRGRGGETSTASPAQCTLTLNNRAGRYSPRNPLGPYYGQLGLNTQLRVTVDSTRRFWGEISELPPKWDTSARDAYVPITATGVLRRTGQWSKATSSGLRQFYMTTSPVTYWSLSDRNGSTRGYPTAGTYRGSTFHRRLGYAAYSFGTATLANYLPPTLRINDTCPAAGWDYMGGEARGSDSTPDALCMEFIYRCDLEVVAGTLAAAPGGLVAIFREFGNGTWDMTFNHDGSADDISLSYTPPGSSLATDLGNTVALDAITDTELHHIRLLLDQNGADVDATIYVDGVSVLTGTLSGHTLAASYGVDFKYDRNSNTADAFLALGHVIVWENLANIPAIADTSLAAAGYSGEAAGRRIERLCDEVGIPFASNGDLDDTLAMGQQFEDSFSGQIVEIETADQGMLYEPRDSFALGYRTRADLYNQAAAFTLNFTALQLADPFEPTDDDQPVRNDVFAQRREGSSYQATLETGRLSVQNPPNGVGRYKDEVQVNVETDDDLPPIAGWLLGLGTVDEPRYPRISVDRAIPGVANNPTLSTAIMTADVGDRFVITNTDSLGIYDDISQIIVGYSETIEPFSHRIASVCVPESPYQVLEVDGTNSRVDPGDDSTLSSSLTSTATSMSVASTGFLWSTAGGDVPFGLMVGGEEMTLTAVSGGSSPQTFTVTRSVNGVVKAHSSSAVVRFKRPGLVAL
jgi:hypothetical protein